VDKKKTGKNKPVSGLKNTESVIETLWGEEEIPAESLQVIKRREAKHRASAEVYTDRSSLTNFPTIILPFRWESLQQEAEKRNVLIKPLIKPVPEAIASVNRELRQIQETGIGRLYVISGVTGSGKTTFLYTLQYFLDDIDIYNAKDMSLDSRYAVEKYLANLKRKKDRNSIVVLEGREAPASLNGEELDILLTSLNADFRRESGHRTLFVIPTTYQALAKTISERAATIGGMTSMNRPFYVFDGPPRSQYFSIVNETMSAFNASRTLREYGVTDEKAKQLAQTAESIGGFIAGCYQEIEHAREKMMSAAHVIQTNRKRVHLWMVFCTMEKDTRRNYSIIRSLTFGDEQHVQVQRILTGDSEEARHWQGQQGSFALAAQYLDLRIMYLPVRTANGIVTAFGDKEFIKHLKNLRLEDGNEVLQREAVRATALESLAGTAIGAFLRGEGFVAVPDSKRPVTPKAQAIFTEIVKKASKDDKSINVTIAEALRAWNKNPDMEVYTELALNETNSLVCDIGIVTPTDIYCLELKWRSSELHESEVIRETASRVREYTRELPEFRSQLAGL